MITLNDVFRHYKYHLAKKINPSWEPLYYSISAEIVTRILYLGTHLPMAPSYPTCSTGSMHHASRYLVIATFISSESFQYHCSAMLMDSSSQRGDIVSLKPCQIKGRCSCANGTTILLLPTDLLPTVCEEWYN